MAPSTPVSTTEKTTAEAPMEVESSDSSNSRRKSFLSFRR
jgi:hypothetical protein